jgi:hypothetical protein
MLTLQHQHITAAVYVQLRIHTGSYRGCCEVWIGMWQSYAGYSRGMSHT